MRLRYKGANGEWVFLVMDGILPDSVADLAELLHRSADDEARKRVAGLRTDLAPREGMLPKRVRYISGARFTEFAEGDGPPVELRFRKRRISPGP
jgi:hypothetical protein